MKKVLYSILTALLISACGGTEPPTNQSIALPDVTLDASTPDRRVVYGPDIIDPERHWVDRLDTSLALRAQLVMDDYLVNNLGGHMAILLRQHDSAVATRVNGAGLACGHLWGHYDMVGTPQQPVCVYESFGEREGERNLFQEHAVPIRDGTSYPLLIESELRGDKKRARVVIGDYDSGWFDDPNTGWDHAVDDSIMFAHVFQTPGAPAWQIRLTDMSVEWRALAMGVEHQRWMTPEKLLLAALGQRRLQEV